MLHRRYSILFTLLMTCLSVMGQVRDIVIKDGAYYSTASLPVDTVHNQSFEKDSIYLIVPRDAQIAYPDYNNRAQLIIWQSGRPIYALPITQYDSLSYVRMLQGDTLRTIFSQQAGSLPIYGKRPIVWQHGQVTVTDSSQVLANDIYQSVAQGNYANFIIQPTEIVRDTQYILCIRDTVYKVQDIYDDTDDVDSIPSVDTIPPTPGRRIGVFSVAADKQVSFSQGNLQYVQSTDTWQFASEQYDYIGKGNIINGQLGQIIDMFGWSADADPANKWGVTIAEEGFDGDFVDWGLNYIHGEAPGSWRTLSQNEWSYLISCRQHATELWGVAKVAGVNGVIILPDRWSPTDDLPFVAGINENGYAAQQTLSVEQWQLMEELGAVFLPAAGGRDGASLASSHIDSVGWYWLSTPTDPDKASCVRFECNLMVQRDGWRQAGLSVRLVHDTIVQKVEPEYVDLGLSVKWATFNVGASSPEDYGDYFAWGETEPKETYSWATYKWCDGTASNITKYNTADGKTILEPADDAAQVHWGGKWRMPTKAECQELIDSCTWEWTTSNNINGYRVTGPNGHSIFLPAGGVRINDVSYAIDEFGYYWSSSLMIDSISEARSIVFTPTSNSCDSDWLYRGRKIRPVYDDRVE